MSMSKNDYEVIAAIIRSHYEVAVSENAVIVMDSIVDSMTDAFKRDNVRFRKDMFIDAATPVWHRAGRGLPPMKRTLTRVHGQRPQPEGF